MSEPPPPGFRPRKPDWPAPPAEPAEPPQPASASPVPSAAARVSAGRAAWPPWMSIAAFTAGFGITIVLGGMVFIVATAAGASEDAPAINIGLTLMQNVALVAAAWIFAAMSGRPAAADFGLRRTRFWSSTGWLVVAWIAFFALSAVWALALDLDEQQDLPEELGAQNGTLNALAVVVLVTVVAPLGEELFFRGFFFGALRNWRGPLLAALLTGFVFGGIHVGSSPVGYLVPLMIFGTVLCLLYERTRSLYPPIALHALNNSVALGASLDYTWQIPAMMVGSTILSLLCAWLLARVIGDGGRPPEPSAPAPGLA